MNTPTPVPPSPQVAQPVMAAIPWYHSPVVIAQVCSAFSGLVALSPKLGWVKTLGLTDPATVESYVTAIGAAAAGVAQAVALLARVRSRIQPVTLTRIAADLHPNTLAADTAQRAATLQADSKAPPNPAP